MSNIQRACAVSACLRWEIALWFNCQASRMGNGQKTAERVFCLIHLASQVNSPVPPEERRPGRCFVPSGSGEFPRDFSWSC